MQMVYITIIFLLAGFSAWGQAAVPAVNPRPAALYTNSPSLQELKQMIWGGPASPSRATATNLSSLRAQAFSAALAGYVPDDKYKLRVGDQVSFQILEDRGEPRLLVVADSGELNFPYIGRVTAVDKTCKELVAESKKLLEKDFYYHATVILALDTANKIVGRVYVWGQVRNQGAVELVPNETMTAGKAILRAGGFGDFANKKKVKVLRSSETQGAAPQIFELNMVEILEDGKIDKDVVLQPNDFIIVPERIFNY